MAGEVITLSSLSREQLLSLLNELVVKNSFVRENVFAYLENLKKQTTVEILGTNEASKSPVSNVSESKKTGRCVTRESPPHEKIRFFMSLFNGRTDIFALRWQNKDGKSGYSPVCKNRFSTGKCNLKIGCKKCAWREFVPLDGGNVLKHLRGDDELCRDVIGLYAIFPDSTCNFLVLDFDEKDFKNDVATIRKTCDDLSIPFGVELSRSGNGAHIWFFFSEKISAKTAREFGSLLIKLVMLNRHEISFSSFDRMFPNQDEIPSGGFGNLIALPLQGQAVKKGCSVFVDENFLPYADQWKFLSGVKKIDAEKIKRFSADMKSKLPIENPPELSTSINNDELKLFDTSSFTNELEITLFDKIYIKKINITEQALGTLKRLAVFHNPQFYEKQKMRLPTYNIPRYIDCSEENKDFLILPRGCFDEVKSLAENADCKIKIEDKRQTGKKIEVTFQGELSEQQQSALSALSKNDTGVLFASTGFGKTVLACAIISTVKTNTLILVHTNALLNQWKKAIGNFLDFKPGIFGGGKDLRTGKIDVALFQSLVKTPKNCKNFLGDYGCVIVDECHHVPAFSFERVLKSIKAKYVYGLTATAFRRDGHDKIIFMQCGPVRYKTDQKQISDSHGFEHFFVPRFVPFTPIENLSQKMPISEYYKFITENEERTKLICNDVVNAIKDGKTPIVISEWVEHLHSIEMKLLSENTAKNIITITGKGTAKQKREILEKLNSVPLDETLIVLATGKYIGEGFDNQRLDTLFLTMPISWKGIVDQYAGRLHRKSATKTEVLIYDYIDFRIGAFERMSHKRIKEYKKLGYTIKSRDKENETATPAHAIYSGLDFKSDFIESIKKAEKEIFISSPYLMKTECEKFLQIAREKIISGVKIFITTKTISESQNETKIKNHSVAVKMLKNCGCTVIEKIDNVQRAAVIDSKTVWFGSANFLGFSSEDDCVIRLEDAVLAAEIVDN